MSGRWRRTVAMLLLGGLAVTGAGCGAGHSAPGEQTLTVYAASSLTGTFTTLAKRFERTHPGVRVDLSFAGSSDLVAQIQQGAPADVFASADEVTMAALTEADLAADPPVVFAGNTLEIAVPPGNPARIRSLADLARPGVYAVVCAPEVPCGAAAVAVARAAGVTLAPVSEEQKVTDVLAKVETGEADAGLVYVTDVRAAGDAVEGIAVPEAARVVNRYPIAPVAGSAHLELAQEFVQLVLSRAGQRTLTDAGFEPAP
ncbi:MAG: molybdate ABC transporter substrate-binding protein [Nocardioides sp.]